MINVINEFWEWCKDNQENIIVDLHGDDLYLYLEFDRDVLNSFVDEFQGFVEECGLDCILQMNGICIDVKNIMGGYGFTMKELWKNRPNDIEFGYW